MWGMTAPVVQPIPRLASALARPPVVLLPACHREVERLPFQIVSRKYVEAVRLAGAVPLVVPAAPVDEFLARLRAAVRRSSSTGPGSDPVVETSSFTVDLATKEVTKNGAVVHLTPTEWGILELLVRNSGKLVTREQLLTEVWGPTYAKSSHYLLVYLAQLRRKLEDDPAHPVHLVTEAGMGHRFRP